ncbi:hypothetical protein MHU86_9950 [Fragilaria crotonensis]|nr:hypothetical protein MHU86_9950 [Fragilaria crotonensis]
MINCRNHFPRAVCEALGGESAGRTYTPCLIPYAGTKLLQLVRENEVTKRKVQNVPHRSIDVFSNPGDIDTLISITKANTKTDVRIKEALEKMVEEAGTEDNMRRLMPLNLTSSKSKMVGLFMAFDGPKKLADLGLKLTTDEQWTLSLGEVTKRAVSKTDLGKLLNCHDVTWDTYPALGVVTAIYFVQGAFTFTGNRDLVNKVGLELNLQPNIPLQLCMGWQCMLNDSCSIIVTEDNKREWIIAIELSTTELRSQMNPIDLADSGNADPLGAEEDFAIPPDRCFALLAIIVVAIAYVLPDWIARLG